MPKHPRRSLPPPASAAAADHPLIEKSPSSSSFPFGAAAARCFLFSVAGFAAATTAIVGRHALEETGEIVVLLFSNYSRGADASSYDDRACVDVDVDVDSSTGQRLFSPRCPIIEDDIEQRDDDDSLVRRAGEALVSIASSPYLRSVPIVLLFLSSTAFVVGVVLTRKELRRLRARARRWKERGIGSFSRQIADVMGMADDAGGEFSVAGTMMHGRVELGNAIWKRAEGVMNRMDAMVLDDVLRKLTKAGVEFSMGALGGIVLYSLPDEMLVGSFADDARSARRRLIRAADPSLERMLFRPGGVWDVLPRNLTEILTKRRLKGHVGAEAIVVRRQEGKENALVGSDERTGGDDLTYDGDDSFDSPMVSHVPSGLSHDNEHQTNSSVDARAKISRQNDDEGSREDVEGGLCATTIDSIVVHNFMGTGCLDGELRIQQFTEKEEEPIPPPLELQLRQILHRTSIAAGLLFLCHLCRSPSTRRAWGSAANLLASLGLASTAIGAGVVSTLLSSNKITAIHPILEVLDLKILEGSSESRSHSYVDRMIKRVCDEIKTNKRLQSALAFFVLYRIRSLTRKGGRHSCNVRQQVGIK